MDITYQLIEPLIVRTEEDGSRMLCEFQVPGSDETVESQATIKRLNSAMGMASRTLKRNLANQVRRGATQALRGVLGGGFVGRTGTSIFNQVTRDQVRDFTSSFTEAEKQAAVLAAFERVSDNFYFDEADYTWKAPPEFERGKKGRKDPDKMSDFEKQLDKHPVTDYFEREVLARLLVEVASVDGRIDEEEREFLDAFIGRDLGSIDEISIRDPLSSTECEEVSPGVRETLYMLAWVTSLKDMHLDARERDLLMKYGNMFGFDTETKMATIMKAKHYVLEQTLTPYTTREELFDHAKQIQLGQKEAEKCMISYKRRKL